MRRSKLNEADRYFQRPGFIERGHAFQRPGFIEGTDGYQWSVKQEASPLGWGTTMRNIRKASDIDFTKHSRKFYRKQLGQDSSNRGFATVLGSAALIVLGMYFVGNYVVPFLN